MTLHKNFKKLVNGKEHTLKHISGYSELTCLKNNNIYNILKKVDQATCPFCIRKGENVIVKAD